MMVVLNDRRRRRLAEELEENGFLLDAPASAQDLLLLDVLDQKPRPLVELVHQARQLP